MRRSLIVAGLLGAATLLACREQTQQAPSAAVPPTKVPAIIERGRFRSGALDQLSVSGSYAYVEPVDWGASGFPPPNVHSFASPTALPGRLTAVGRSAL